MFTGIIQKPGRVTEIQTDAATGRLCIDAGSWDRPLEVGESIAVNGVCLTLVEHADRVLSFDVLQESFARTNLGAKKVGSVVNLERAVCLGDSLGGHVVSGHVDGPGVLEAIKPVGRDWMITVSCSDEIMAEIVYKGSVTIDGISLTVAALKDDSFDVHIIPHTWKCTDLSDLSVGDSVNLETDVVAKYVRRMIEGGIVPVEVNWDEIRRTGLIEG